MRLPILLTLASPIFLGACGPGSAHAGGSAGAGRATEFVLRSIEGRPVSLSDYLGKNLILINFYGSWCTACESELTHLERLYQSYRGRGLVVLGISMDGPESVAMVGPQTRRVGVTYPVLLDEETRVTAIYNPHRTAPLSLLIDREGRIRLVHMGYLAGDERVFEGHIKALLAGEAAPRVEKH